MNIRRYGGVALAALLLSGCMPYGFGSTTARLDAPPGASSSDIAFGDTPGLVPRSPAPHARDGRIAAEMEREARRAEIRLLEHRQIILGREADSGGRVGRWLSPRVEGVDRDRYNASSEQIERLERDLRSRP